MYTILNAITSSTFDYLVFRKRCGTMTTKCPEEGEIIASVLIGIQVDSPNSKDNMLRHAWIKKKPTKSFIYVLLG